MTPDCAPKSAIYELTVAGGIGPVLRFALKPHTVTRTQVCTILRARPSADRDLVDLMELLESRGLQVDDVSRIDTRDERPTGPRAGRGINAGINE